MDVFYGSQPVVADFNGDGVMDLAVGESRGVTVFLGSGGGGFGEEIQTPLTGPLKVLLGDFNEDGVPDLIAFSQGFGTMNVLLGSSNGHFSIGPAIVLSNYPVDIGVGDFDGDGHLDVIAAESNSSYLVRLYLGDGHGGLTPAGAFPTGLTFPYPSRIAVGDFNGDHRPDVVVSGAYPGISVLLATPTGFEAPRLISPFAAFDVVQAQDATGDGKADLVGLAGDVFVFAGDGAGGFAAPVQVPMGGYLSFLLVVDLDGDGKPDLAGLSYQTGQLTTRLGDGGGSFGPPMSTPFGFSPFAFAVADLDADGIADFAVSTSFGIRLGFGDGTGAVAALLSYPIGSAPQSIAASDFDGDGKMDVAVANSQYPAGVTVRSGNGLGGFGPDTFYGGADLSYSLVAVDLDGDNKAELIARDYASIQVFLNDGAGHFSVLAPVLVCQFFGALVVADIDKDGKKDIVAPCSDRVQVLLGDGHGGFGAPIETLFPSGVGKIVVGDLDGDGFPDLVVIGGFATEALALLGDGTGHFGAPIHSPIPFPSVSGLVLADFDGDGNLDIAVGHFLQGNHVDILPGDGAGSFGAGASFPMLSSAPSLAADLNGDGFPDLIANTGDGLEILMNDGHGAFLPSIIYAAGSSTSIPVAADFNGDGLMDLVAAGAISNSVSLLLNTSCQARHLAAVPRFPACSPPGSSLTPDLVVRVEDDAGDLVACAAGTVTATLLPGTPGAILSGSTTVPIVSGLATFSGLSINLPGTFRLRFTHSGPAQATAGSVRVGSGVATSISGTSSICATNPVIYDAGPGFSRYIWTLDGLPVSFQQTVTLGFLAPGLHALAVRVAQGGCEAEAFLSIGNAPPQLNSVTPPSAPGLTGTPVALSGACFEPGATASFGGVLAGALSVPDSSNILASAPPHAIGTFDVVVTNPDGQAAILPASFTYTGASRIFVAASGIDANDCSNVATPCRTLTGAVAQTPPSGTVIVLASGSYGGVTISKAITIQAGQGVTAFLAQQILVLAGPSDAVILRGLTSKAVAPGSGVGIYVGSAGSVVIESCAVSDWQYGMIVGLSAPVTLAVNDSIVRNCSQAGIYLQNARATLDKVSLNDDGIGIAVFGSAQVRRSVISGASIDGVLVLDGGSLDIVDCVVSNNLVGVNVRANSFFARARVSSSIVTDNGTGLLQFGFGVLLSLGDNTIEGNGTDIVGTVGTYAPK